MYITQFTQQDQMRYAGIDASEKTMGSGKVSAHWHEFYELELVIDGAGSYTIDGTDYEIRSGALFFMCPVSFHQVHFTKDTRLINIMFRPELCDTTLLFRLFSKKTHLSVHLVEDTASFLRTLCREITAEIKNEAYATALLNCVCQKLLQSDVREDNHPVLPMQKAMLYIQNHFKHNITLTEAAAVAGLSPNYFSEQFHQYTDTTFKAYVNNLRFSYAEKLLLYTTLSITEICFECGFNDYSHFLSAFRKQFGVTPTQYRKRMLNT